jgi:hypothetical protein
VLLTSCPSSANGVHINPIESNILFYTLRILHLGIQLHFVFDGPKRLSNGGKLYPGHDAPSLLLQDTLTHTGVPWHEAPAEAEAECAKMEMEGVVDGVWSEDGDCLAFGCQTLIKSYFEIQPSTGKRDSVRKSFKLFRVYKLEDLARQYPGMDREGFILYAILNGRPNNVGELYNLGPQDVLNAAGHGLGRSLCAASRSGKDLRQWATDFAGYLQDTGSNIEIPPEFPRWEHVQDYLNPVASTPEVFLDLPQSRDPSPDEALFSFLVDKFQWSIDQWVKYAVPSRIVQSLLATEEGKESQHDCLKLECDLKKKSSKKAKATFLICKATSLDVSALYETKGVLETLPWILRKANFNDQPSIASYFITPKSDQKDKGKSSASASAKPFQRLEHGAEKQLPTPPSGSASSSNGEGPSKRRERYRRQSTPPSPTPAPRKRKLPWDMGVSISKNIRPAPKNDHGTLNKTKDSGKGKGKEILASPRANAKRARSPANSNSRSNEEVRDKMPKLAAEQRPSIPPAQITEPVDAVNDFIMIDSDSDEELYDKGPKPAAEQLPSTPPAQISDPNDFIMIDSDSNEDEYGSFPPVADLPTVLEDTTAKVIHDDSLVSSSSGNEYGSFPASPELRALM